MQSDIKLLSADQNQIKSKKFSLTNAVQHGVLHLVVLLFVHRRDLEKRFGCFGGIRNVHLCGKKTGPPPESKISVYHLVSLLAVFVPLCLEM